VHHSDRGVQYACRKCRDLLEEHGMAQSMSRSGDCYDNAMMESLWATLKKELVRGRRFRTDEEARLAVFERIEVWYQRTRIHGLLHHVSPEAFEAATRAGQGQDGCPPVVWKSRDMRNGIASPSALVTRKSVQAPVRLL
jgi:putative transposase